MIVKKLTNEVNQDVETVIKDEIKAKFTTNSDGFFVSSKLDKAEIRTMVKSEALSLLDQVNLDSLITHGRFGTAGALNVSNVHGWTIDNWQLAHNGQVFDYADKGRTWNFETKDWDYPDNAKTDSLILFEDIMKRINQLSELSNKKIAKVIRHALADISFWGRACLYDQINDRLFLFGDWYTYLIGNYVLISSSDLMLTNKKVTKVHGMSFEQVGNISEELIDGVNLIQNFSRPDFHFKPMGHLITKPRTYQSKEVGFKMPKDDLGTYHNPRIDYREYEKPDKDDEIDYVGMYGNSFLMKNISGEVVECVQDQYGIHDLMFSCCDMDMCDMFTDLTDAEVEAYKSSNRDETHRKVDSLALAQ